MTPSPTKKSTAPITRFAKQDSLNLSELLVGKYYLVHGIKRRCSRFNPQRLLYALLSAVSNDFIDSKCRRLPGRGGQLRLSAFVESKPSDTYLEIGKSMG
jgi:hypothetical protein